MKLFVNLILLILVELISSIRAITLTPTLETNHGLIIGESITSAGCKYSAYKSIPYAKPPVGELRFEQPEPQDTKWTGILNATKTAPICLQWSELNSEDPIIGSEDCLYLNIFVPDAGGRERNSLLPVMVFIHGGGLMWGSSDFYGEDYIMRDGRMILVTLNYRLGPMGFLSTEDDAIPGNMGFKDQALALKWIYENILYFGGDKGKILLTGWSAGGVSAHFHMLSKYTKPEWFSAVVSFSGSALFPGHDIYQGEAKKRSAAVAVHLNCTAEELKSSRAIKHCLKSKKAEDIVKTIPKFHKFGSHPFAVFGPVIENPDSPQSFLTDHVRNLMKAGKTKSKPLLITRTAEDGAVGAAEFLQRDSNGKERISILSKRWVEIIPIMLFFNITLSQEQHEKLALDLKEKYFGASPVDMRSFHSLENLFNDVIGIEHIEGTAELYVKFTPNAHAYGYVYDNPAPFGLGNLISERNDWKFGTLHGDDIFIIFKTGIRRNHPLREDEVEISRNLIGMLVNMAQCGIPSYNGVALTSLSLSNKIHFQRITRDGLIKN